MAIDNDILFEDWHDCIRCWKVSCCYALNACIGLHSIAGLNIAVIDTLKRLGPFINLMLSHYLLATDIQFDYSTVGIYMSATGCVIGAIGFGFHSKIELASG